MVSFRSPRLDALVTEALRNNWSIQAAQANLRKAAEGLHAAQGSLMPQIDATGAEGRQEYGASLFGPWAWTFPLSPPTRQVSTFRMIPIFLEATIV
ncbi:TolC family protein [Komagataeibacter rhaeticus]|nr:TolC family protein [Komagataeibacter rhaeticus]